MEEISALMDGELDEHRTGQHLARLKEDKQLRDCWDTFHLIGDLMRGERPLSRVFESEVYRKLASEPTILAPRRNRVKRITAYAFTAAASVLAVAAVGWIAFFDNPLAPPTEVAAIQPNAPAPANPPRQLASVPSDGTMNEYLIAHQEYSPSTAIQGLAPYIRTVSGPQTTTRR